MIVKVLDVKEELSNKVCYLCEIPLDVYMQNLPRNFMEYHIQRGIVSNLYLDNLIETVLKGAHIPPITLVADSEYAEMDSSLKIKNFKILDGLQRTYRLKVIWETVLLLEKVVGDSLDIFELSKFQISRIYREKLRDIDSSISILMKLIKFCEKNPEKVSDLRNRFKVKQWFEVWDNLSPEDEIEKMLILNAGHKQMSLKHQLELLFLNILPTLNSIGREKDSRFKLIREKEMSSASYSKNREIGQFYFPHFISATVSFINKDVITSNTSLIKEIQEEGNSYLESRNLLNYDFIKALVIFLVELDEQLYEKYGHKGTNWISRETVLTGLFGALGKASFEKDEQPEDILKEFIFLLNTEEKDYLQIDEYNKLRSNIDLGRVNIGNLTKKAVYQGVYELMNSGFGEPINWNIWFEGEKDGNDFENLI